MAPVHPQGSFLNLGSFPEGDPSREMIEAKFQACKIFHKLLQIAVLQGWV